MSIVYQSEAGWVLDHEAFLNNIYRSCVDVAISHSLNSTLKSCPEVAKQEDNTSYKDKSIVGDTHGKIQEVKRKFTVKDTLFDIYEQFLMDSCFSKEVCEEEDSAANVDIDNRTSDIPNTPVTVSKSRCRRKKPSEKVQEMNEAMKASLKRQTELNTNVDIRFKEVIGFCQRNGYFKTAISRPRSNNTEARLLAKELENIGPPFNDWCLIAKQFETDSTDFIDLSDGGSSDGKFPSVVNVEMRNAAPFAIVRRLLGDTFLIPPRSSFLMSDISLFSTLLNGVDNYDVVVMDPPWQNKSVRRKRKYREMWVDDLLQIHPMLRPGGLLVVWTTNKLVHQRFVTDTLFPHWGAHHEATWHWVKVTKLGDYITDIKDVHGKRPYETILIGRVESVPTEATQTDSQTNSKAPTTDNKDGEKISEEQSQVASGRDLSQSSAECKGHRGEDKCFRTGHISEVKSYLPDKRVIVSIPCSIHSSKPPLSEVLQPYLPESARCLELFARNLLPGWMSWGNETLKFQNIRCYDEIKDT